MKMEDNIMETLITELKKLNIKYTLEKGKLTVNESLDLSGTSIKELPEGLTVGGYLDLHGTPIKALPEGLTVGGSLYLYGTPIKELPEGLTVGCDLDLHCTPIKALPEGLTVGGSLNLRGTSIEKLPENLIIGGSLYLNNTPIKELPEGLRVGQGIAISNTFQIMTQKSRKKLINGTYVEGKYLYADNILTLVKKKKKFGNYTIYIGKIPRQFVISNDVHFAHCSSLREGISDLEFKEALDRGMEQYKDFTLDTIVTLEEAKTMYRVITGACKFGTDNFVNNLSERKETYTVRECIELTKGQYNAEVFARFFNK